MSSTPNTAATSSTPNHFFADLYTFTWSGFDVRLPLVSAAAVALCLAVGIALGHPGGALVAAGGALTVGFGANQRIGDSRILPMIFAVLGMATATLIGTLVGHRGYTILIFSGVAAAIYGFLTIRNTGLAWVGQQAAVSLFVASAYPSGPRLSFIRAGLIVMGGAVQLVFTSAGLRLIPELHKDLLSISSTFYHSLLDQRREFLHRLHDLPKSLPAPDRRVALLYAARLVVTVVLATEIDRRLKLQSGYWVPMTALLVQKPAFFETLVRGLLRTGGTLAGAFLATLLASHIHIGPEHASWILAAITTFFAFWTFATLSVNYGLYSLCITSYIVFLLALNQTPGPEIAHRRFFCTAAGAGIALLIHLDGLRRHRDNPTAA